MKAPTSRSGEFVCAAFALVEVMIIAAAIALHLAIICIVLALPIPRLKPASVLPLVKSTRPQIARDLTTLAARTH